MPERKHAGVLGKGKSGAAIIEIENALADIVPFLGLKVIRRIAQRVGDAFGF